MRKPTRVVTRPTTRAVDLPDLMTAREVAVYCGVHRATVDRLVSLGRFALPVRFGSSIVRFRREAVLQFLAERESGTPSECRTRKVNRDGR
jgi:excisionase family DNA binding protein